MDSRYLVFLQHPTLKKKNPWLISETPDIFVPRMSLISCTAVMGSIKEVRAPTLILTSSQKGNSNLAHIKWELFCEALSIGC